MWILRVFCSTRNGSGFLLSLGFKRGKATLQFLKALCRDLIIATETELRSHEITRDRL